MSGLQKTFEEIHERLGRLEAKVERILALMEGLVSDLRTPQPAPGPQRAPTTPKPEVPDPKDIHRCRYSHAGLAWEPSDARVGDRGRVFVSCTGPAHDSQWHAMMEVDGKERYACASTKKASLSLLRGYWPF